MRVTHSEEDGSARLQVGAGAAAEPHFGACRDRAALTTDTALVPPGRHPPAVRAWRARRILLWCGVALMTVSGCSRTWVPFDACFEAGATRACTTDCGPGLQSCDGRRWGDCMSPATVTTTSRCSALGVRLRVGGPLLVHGGRRRVGLPESAAGDGSRRRSREPVRGHRSGRRRHDARHHAGDSLLATVPDASAHAA